MTNFQISSTAQNLWDYPVTTVTSQLMGEYTKLRQGIICFKIYIYLSARMKQIAVTGWGFKKLYVQTWKLYVKKFDFVEIKKFYVTFTILR